MARKPPATPTEPDDEPLPGETMEEYEARQNELDVERYMEWEKADPRNPRKVDHHTARFLEGYDPHLGNN